MKNKLFLPFAMVGFVLMLLFSSLGVSTEAFATAAKPTTATAVFPDSNQGLNASEVVNKNDDVNNIVGTMIKLAQTVSVIIFGVAVLVIVWAGFKYTTSQGDPKTTESAKMQIIAAGIGIGISLFALIIVRVFASVYDGGAE